MNLVPIIAVDPGISCGWATRDAGGVLASGVWALASRRHESPGMRFVRLGDLLAEKIETSGSKLLFYEEVRAHSGTQAAHLYGGFEAIIQRAACCLGVEFQSVAVGEWKRAALGKGNVSEAAYFLAAQERWPEAGIKTSDEAAARFIADSRQRVRDLRL